MNHPLHTVCVGGGGADGRRPSEPPSQRPHQRRTRKHCRNNGEPSPSLLLCCASLFVAFALCQLYTCTGAAGDGGLHWTPSLVAHAFSAPPTGRASRPHHSRGTSVRVASELYEASAASTREELERMTVKQLKSYMAENGIEVPRGQGASLKLKKHIVDFIWEQQADVNGSGANGEASTAEPLANGAANGEVNGEDVVGPTKRPSPAKKRMANRLSSGTGMPPLPQTAERVAAIMADDEEDTNEGEASSTYHLTPKDRIVLDVLNRYPPLHESIVDACADNENMGDLPLEGITTANIEHCDLNSLNYVVPSGVGEDDIRHAYHPMVANATQSDMDAVFIGTASCTPGVTRGVSCTALRLNWRSGRPVEADKSKQQSLGQKKKAGTYVEERGPTGGTWLFDCGESTQLSIQKTASVKPGKISKIFITHCHGDHSFGLPGLLCLMGTDRDRDAPPVEIYGPEGLRMWLRVAIRYSVSRVVPPYRVHELMDVPMAPEWEEGHRRNGRFYFQLRRDAENNAKDGKKGNRRWGMQGLAGADPVSWISRAPMLNLEPSRDFGEIDGGRDIFPMYDHPQATDGAPVWEVESEEDVTVLAAPMSHGVPCVGYVVREHDRPGRLRPENVHPVIERNREGLKEAGIPNPVKVMAMVKNLPVGGSYTFPDGTVLRQEDVVEPPRRGRKVVICGDTADCRALEGLAQDCDLLVHEATNTFLPGVDKDGNMKLVTRDAKIHGHSTPFMAGYFAKRINAKNLCLNHFSARYKGDQSIESITIMTRMERQAMKASGLTEESVAAAWDFMVLPVARNG